MITMAKGDMFASRCEALVNPVNCVGVMGAGLALLFKKRFPDSFTKYKKDCDDGKLDIGLLSVTTFSEYPKESSIIKESKYIICFPTKKHYRDDSRLEYIEAGCVTLANYIKDHNIKSVAIPALGCGLGGLYWPDVKKAIVKSPLYESDAEIYLFEPI